MCVFCLFSWGVVYCRFFLARSLLSFWSVFQKKIHLAFCREDPGGLKGCKRWSSGWGDEHGVHVAFCWWKNGGRRTETKIITQEVLCFD